MEERLAQLRKEKAQLIERLAELEVELAQAEGRDQGIPHYLKIEEAAHALGQEVSRQVQERRMAEVVESRDRQVRCPACGKWVEGKVAEREVTSVDGEVRLKELRGECPSCRRAFFPSA